MKLKILTESFSINRLNPNESVPVDVFKGSFYSITKTDEELSIVCPSSIPVQSTNTETNWSCIKIQGPLDFLLIGILEKISAILAEAKMSIFAISTFETDYISLKTD